MTKQQKLIAIHLALVILVFLWTGVIGMAVPHQRAVLDTLPFILASVCTTFVLHCMYVLVKDED